jgi:hypothetical protein
VTCGVIGSNLSSNCVKSVQDEKMQCFMNSNVLCKDWVAIVRCYTALDQELRLSAAE